MWQSLSLENYSMVFSLSKSNFPSYLTIISATPNLCPFQKERVHDDTHAAYVHGSSCSFEPELYAKENKGETSANGMNPNRVVEHRPEDVLLYLHQYLLAQLVDLKSPPGASCRLPRPFSSTHKHSNPFASYCLNSIGSSSPRSSS